MWWYNTCIWLSNSTLGYCSLTIKFCIYFYAPKIEDRGAYCFCPVCHSVIPSFCLSVIPSFCHSLWNFNLANNFWTGSARALIFHMNIPCDKTFPWVPLFFTLWPWPWSLTHFLKTLTLVITFWTVGARALIFHMSIPCDKTFPWEPLFFTLWLWPWSLTHFLKTFTLLITLE